MLQRAPTCLMNTIYGELAALATAFFWTVTALSFETAGKKLGSLPVNMIRLWGGFIFLSIYSWFSRGMFIPLDASSHAWFWLFLSGLIGFSLGDLFLFKAFTTIGSRISMLIMASVPPITALLGWIFLGETLALNHYIGMVLTISGISMVIMTREIGKKNVTFSYPLKGLLLAFGGAIGQAVGLVLSKYGMGDYNAFAATQIRIIAGITGFVILFIPMRAWGRTLRSFKNRTGIGFTMLGAFFGPFLGVSFSLLAIQNTETGVASTIMAIVPVLIIAPAVVIFKEKVNLKEIVGAIIAVTGTAVMFL
jgi:drug/metabolite transporter (DMT)-like permease